MVSLDALSRMESITLLDDINYYFVSSLFVAGHSSPALFQVFSLYYQAVLHHSFLEELLLVLVDM